MAMTLATSISLTSNISTRLSINQHIHFMMGSALPPLLTTCLIFLLFFLVNCTTPENPIECSSENTNCVVTNAYGSFPDRSICHAANAAYPTTEDELISIVAEATKAKRKMKVATRYSHSIPKLVCPDGEDGLVISTEYLNQTLNIDTESMTISVQSGATLRQLIEEAAQCDLALPYAPYWSGLTIGGLLSTGAHGSTLWNPSSVHDYVLELTIVSPGESDQDGYVKVRTLDASNINEFNAAKVSLGVLGVISKVTLQLEPLFKRSITYKEESDAKLADKIESFGRDHEFADINWYPSQKKAVYRIDDRTSDSSSPDNGHYDFIPFRATPEFEAEAVRKEEEFEEALMMKSWIGYKTSSWLKCKAASVKTAVLLWKAYGLTNDGKHFKGYPVTGYNNNLQASASCVNSSDHSIFKEVCPWDPRIEGLFYFQTTISIRLSDVKNFIQDVQQLVNLDPRAFCGLQQYDGILIRYGKAKASSAFLGKDEDTVDFDMTYYRSRDPTKPRLHEDVIEEIEQMALFKYEGFPHWAKNRNIAFDGVIKKYKNAEEFLKVKDMYDPLGLFSSEWTDQILGVKGNVTIVKEGCALEGLCICSHDRHCAPKKGYVCRPGKIYKEARVCAYDKSKLTIEDVAEDLMEDIMDFDHFQRFAHAF